MDEDHYTFQDKLKMYENLLRSYQEELEKKTKESMKLKVDLDLLNMKYTSLVHHNLGDQPSIATKGFQEELQQKNSHIENLKSTLSSLKDTLRKTEKKNSLLKLEIEKKETFIKELLYEKKQVEMDLEEKTLQIQSLSNKSPTLPSPHSEETAQIQEELDLSKNINKTLITLLKFKNIELEQMKNNNNNHSFSTNEEENEEKIEKFKAQEKVLMDRLGKQMQEFGKFSKISFEEWNFSFFLCNFWKILENIICFVCQ